MKKKYQLSRLTLCLTASLTLLSGVTTSSFAAQQNIDESYKNTALSPDQRADIIVKQLTLDEKLSWLSGATAVPAEGHKNLPGAIGSAAYYPALKRFGIPAIQESDAGLGVGNMNNVRPGDNSTALPSSLVLAATFDPALAEKSGELLGNEAHSKGFNVQLAGGADLIREPRGGRDFEYVSEDPLLTGLIAGNTVKGIQSQHVVSTVKHFAVNSQETGRVLVSSDIDKQPLQESDLLAFKIALDIGHPGSIMPGYNLINGEWATENAYLLNEVLKGEWGYKGWVMSDWGATHSTVKSVLAGLDVESGNDLDPQIYLGEPLRKAIEDKQIPISRIDDMVKRQLRSLFAVGAIDFPARPGVPIDYPTHKLQAQEVAEKGIVLLKNANNLLPLPMGLKKILVIGAHADKGVLSGGGSSNVYPIGSYIIPGTVLAGWHIPKVYQPSSPLLAIESDSGSAEVKYIDGKNLEQVAHEASDADAVIVFAESWRHEGGDVANLSLPDNQDRLISAAAKANKQTIVVLETGGAVKMPWLNQVSGVLAAFYPGTGGADAIAGILFGRVDPSGHLPITFPADENQLPRVAMKDPATTTSNPGAPTQGGVFHENYNIEGADVGYRWFERKNEQPLFPFGFGLSYTTFSTRDLQVEQSGKQLAAHFVVKNTGDRAGADVAQIYARQADNAGSVYRLVGFQRVELKAGEEKTVSVNLEPRLFASFNLDAKDWEIKAGKYDVKLADDYAQPGIKDSLTLSAVTIK